MGQLVITSGSSVYVDAQIVIYTLEKVNNFCKLLLPLWKTCGRKEIKIISSELTFMETLIGPMKKNDIQLIRTYENMLLRTEINLLPITLSILKTAVTLRASNNIRTPDAIHIATALETKCNLFLTNDLGFIKNYK